MGLKNLSIVYDSVCRSPKPCGDQCLCMDEYIGRTDSGPRLRRWARSRCAGFMRRLSAHSTSPRTSKGPSHDGSDQGATTTYELSAGLGRCAITVIEIRNFDISIALMHLDVFNFVGICLALVIKNSPFFCY